MKICRRCKEPFEGEHIIFYFNGKAGGGIFHCSLCEEEFDD